MWLKNWNLFLGRVENSVGKGENAGYHSVFKRLVLQTRKNQCFRNATLIFDLGQDRWYWPWYQREGHMPRNTPVKYQSYFTYHSKVIANVKVFSEQKDKQINTKTYRQGKNYIFLIYQCMGIKRTKILVTSIFSLLSQRFQKLSVSGSLKVAIMW